MTLTLRSTSTRNSKGNGQTNHLPTIFITMDSVTDKKKDQIKALIEKMKQEGKPIDWATTVLC